MFEVGAAVCGAAPSMNALILGRVIVGVGADGLYIGAMNIISAFTSEQTRARCFSYFGISWGLGTM